jgi:PEP-CTERM motif-containing protein
MRRIILKSVAATCLCVCASLAQANAVRLDNYTFDPASSVTVASPGYSGGAGQFVGVLDGNAFTTFCTDLSQVFYFGTPYNDYSVINGTTAWGAARETLLGQLFTFAIATNFITDADRSAAIQSAVWEILYETTATSPHAFDTGSFQVSSGSGGTTAALGLIDWNAIANGPDAFQVSQLFSANEQDFLVLTPTISRLTVPEPPAYALLMLGLICAGVFLRRRSR